ncbi:hypothetical protein AB0B25_31915 [Nocardia sp. NPDC049190]|uniref:hypothetical protein n=1 Tax=Nocardia sp. NPDC049190 TaxID=3155650 RepID=UPI0033FEC6C8
MRTDGASGRTIADKQGFLNAGLKVAVRRRLMPWDPCEDSTLPPRHYEPTFLEPEEFDYLYSITPARRDLRPTRMTLATTCAASRAWKYTGNAEKRRGEPKSRTGIRTTNDPQEVVAEPRVGHAAADPTATRTGPEWP